MVVHGLMVSNIFERVMHDNNYVRCRKSVTCIARGRDSAAAASALFYRQSMKRVDKN